jgi:DNA-3-methyladenine glycosylase I
MHNEGQLQRCEWAAGSDELNIRHHDEEWGVPVHDDLVLFEFLILEGAQAGLSWTTILRKRDNYRRAFAGFDPARVAVFDEANVEELMQDAGIIRNRAKIEAAVGNAHGVLVIQRDFGSLDAYIWQFVDGSPIQNSFRSLGELPAETEESRRMSKDLKKRGFRFVGPTICYAFMEACGLVNDHVVGCFRYDEIRKAGQGEQSAT